MDIENFLKHMVLILQMQCTSVDDIVEACLAKMLEGTGNARTYDQAKSALFTHDFGRLCVLFVRLYVLLLCRKIPSKFASFLMALLGTPCERALQICVSCLMLWWIFRDKADNDKTALIFKGYGGYFS